MAGSSVQGPRERGRERPWQRVETAAWLFFAMEVTMQEFKENMAAAQAEWQGREARSLDVSQS